MPIDQITAALKFYEREQDDEPTAAKLAGYEFEALTALTDRDEVLDALYDNSQIDEMIGLIVSGEDDTELGRLVRVRVVEHIRSQGMFDHYVGKLIAAARGAKEWDK